MFSSLVKRKKNRDLLSTTTIQFETHLATILSLDYRQYISPTAYIFWWFPWVLPKEKKRLRLQRGKYVLKENTIFPPTPPNYHQIGLSKMIFVMPPLPNFSEINTNWQTYYVIYLAFLSFLLSSGRILIVPRRRNPQMCDEDKRLTLHLSFASTTSFSTPAYFLRASAIKETSTMPTSVGSKTLQSVENYSLQVSLRRPARF